MRWHTLRGREKWLDPRAYLVDWDAKSLSKFQWSVKQFLRRHWERHRIYEEMPVVGTRMRLDFYNGTLRVAVECDGEQHNGYNRHFHRGSLSVFQSQMKRDDDKEKWCVLNGITLVRIYPDDVVNLSRAWFKREYDLDI